MEEENKDYAKYPASAVQEQFWTVNKLHPATPAHNIPSLFQINGKLNLEILETAIGDVVCRHSIFRTTFCFQEGKLIQKVTDKNQIKINRVDTFKNVSENTNAGTAQIIKREIEKPFNLADGPLIRIKTVKLKEEEYILILTMHHIITDLRTKDLFAEELAVAYNSAIKGVENFFPAPKKQYTEYAITHNEWLQGNDYAKQLEYWKTQLKDKSAVMDFPFDFNRPKNQALNGTAYPFHLTKLQTKRLKSFSRNHNVNAFLMLLTVYIVLLQKYTQQNTIVVGVPLTNRRGERMEDILGCFASILPLPVDMSDNPHFLDLLKRIRLSLLGNHRNQEVPFNAIVDTVHPKRSAAYNPIFQVGFTFEHPMKLEIDGLEIKSLPVHSGGSQLDIFPVLWETDEEIQGYIEYNTELFEESTIERFVANYLTLLDGIEKNTNQTLSQLSILSEAERQEVLYKWNKTDRAYHQAENIVALFEKQVEQTPKAIAIDYNNTCLTFEELNLKANSLAHYLHEENVSKGTPVGLLMHRSLGLIVAIFGIIKAGGVYVPLDPEYPDERIDYMIQHVQMPVLLTHKNFADQIKNNSLNIINLDDKWSNIESLSSINPGIQINKLDPIYIIFTSGSTGRPKGVINTHGAIHNRIQWMQDYFSITHLDCILQKTPYSFDVSVWEFFWPLSFGAKLVVAPPFSHKDPGEMIRLINQFNVSTIHFVPSMLRAFLDHPNSSSCSSLTRVICSGEPLPGDLRNTFFKHLDARLYNLYGPTEAAVDVTAWQCNRDDQTKTVPIGKPIANTRIYILDQHMQPVHIGIPGEIYIGGVQLAEGYYAQPELTKEKFVPDPFSSVAGARLYRTGDLAKYLPDGNIEYLRRTDFQVKIRGLRIELGEIEMVLCSCSGISNAKVVTQEHVHGDKKLIAYIVPDKKYMISMEQLEDNTIVKSENWKPYTLPNGLLISHINKGETDFMYKEIFENNVYFNHGIVLPDEACVLDVGANIGMFSLYIAEKVENASIYSLEPIPPIFSVLQQNASLYGNSITPLPFGLSNSSRSEKFTYYPHVSIISGSHADFEEDKNSIRAHLLNEATNKDGLSEEILNDLFVDRLKNEQFECSLKTISEIISEQQIEKIDLLKIDVEKSEYEVLEGISTEDWAIIGQIVIEVHSLNGQLEKVVNHLTLKGYHLSIDHNPEAGLHLLYAVNPSYSAKIAAQSLREIPTKNPPPAKNQVQFINNVKQLLANKLPDYMIPSAFVILDSMPTTQSGKIDTLSLPEPETEQLKQTHEYIGPISETEKLLASYWSELLKTDQIGVFDNFFDLGGSSLLAAYLVSMIQARLNTEVSIVKMFQFPTIHSFAKYLTQDQTDHNSMDQAKNRAELRKDAMTRRLKSRRKITDRRKTIKRKEDKLFDQEP